MATTFLVPDLGEGLEEVTIVRWHVAAGDVVALNEVLCTVETAKAEVDIPSPYAGTIGTLGGAEGETLRVGAVLAGYELDDAASPPAPSGGVAAGAAGGSEAARQPTLVGYGLDESLDRSRRQRGRAGGTTPTSTPVHKPLAKPPVRKLARDRGVDLTSLVGTGPGGVITRADVESASTVPKPDAVEATATATATAPMNASPPDERIPVTGIRRRIADHLSESRSTIPDATASVTVECSRLLDLRVRMNDALEQRGSERVVTPFGLICHFLVTALASDRTLNARFVANGSNSNGENGTGSAEIVRFGSIHLGVGTATDRGLVVVVARDADRRNAVELATELARLSTAARDGSVAPTELVGSTFTVSNFGALGLDDGIPVINHPEAAILGVGSIRPRPIVIDGEVVARPTASLTLAFDHRVCDGAEAARLLTAVAQLIEQPDLLALHR